MLPPSAPCTVPLAIQANPVKHLSLLFSDPNPIKYVNKYLAIKQVKIMNIEYPIVSSSRFEDKKAAPIYPNMKGAIRTQY